MFDEPVFYEHYNPNAVIVLPRHGSRSESGLDRRPELVVVCVPITHHQYVSFEVGGRIQ